MFILYLEKTLFLIILIINRQAININNNNKKV